jgi:hypothetical protein
LNSFLICRKIGPFRKQLYNEDNVERNNTIDCAIPMYQDTVLNTVNGSVPKDAIRNNSGENRSSNVYAVVVKKHPSVLFVKSILIQAESYLSIRDLSPSSLLVEHDAGATNGIGTTHPSGVHEFTPVFSGVRVTRSLGLYVYFVDRYLSF